MAGIAARYPGADIEKVKKDQTIFLRGALATHMYLVLEGQVQILIGDRVVDVVNPGGIFGEMALVDDKPRGGTAVATSDAVLLRFDEKQFLKVLRESPDFALKVLRTVVERVRRADVLGGLTPDREGG